MSSDEDMPDLPGSESEISEPESESSSGYSSESDYTDDESEWGESVPSEPSDEDEDLKDEPSGLETKERLNRIRLLRRVIENVQTKRVTAEQAASDAKDIGISGDSLIEREEYAEQLRKQEDMMMAELKKVEALEHELQEAQAEKEAQDAVARRRDFQHRQKIERLKKDHDKMVDLKRAQREAEKAKTDEMAENERQMRAAVRHARQYRAKLCRHLMDEEDLEIDRQMNEEETAEAQKDEAVKNAKLTAKTKKAERLALLRKQLLAAEVNQFALEDALSGADTTIEAVDRTTEVQAEAVPAPVSPGTPVCEPAVDISVWVTVPLLRRQKVVSVSTKDTGVDLMALLIDGSRAIAVLAPECGLWMPAAGSEFGGPDSGTWMDMAATLGSYKLFDGSRIEVRTLPDIQMDPKGTVIIVQSAKVDKIRPIRCNPSRTSVDILMAKVIDKFPVPLEEGEHNDDFCLMFDKPGEGSISLPGDKTITDLHLPVHAFLELSKLPKDILEERERARLAAEADEALAEMTPMVDPNETPLAPTPESEIRKDDTPEQVADELLNKIEEKQEETQPPKEPEAPPAPEALKPEPEPEAEPEAEPEPEQEVEPEPVVKASADQVQAEPLEPKDEEEVMVNESGAKYKTNYPDVHDAMEAQAVHDKIFNDGRAPPALPDVSENEPRMTLTVAADADGPLPPHLQFIIGPKGCKIGRSRSYNNHIVIPGREVLPELGDDTVSRAQVVIFYKNRTFWVKQQSPKSYTGVAAKPGARSVKCLPEEDVQVTSGQQLRVGAKTKFNIEIEIPEAAEDNYDRRNTAQSADKALCWASTTSRLHSDAFNKAEGQRCLQVSLMSNTSEVLGCVVVSKSTTISTLTQVIEHTFVPGKEFNLRRQVTSSQTPIPLGKAINHKQVSYFYRRSSDKVIIELLRGTTLN